ncbi:MULTISPECIES: SagB family peptide dehydrogenase [Pectobacterium]|jgi:SagB-type dehydrogenase family enzyme|uniref:SagB family peptide dehydrogenase n=2 Tax=Pectobacterium TaxID=122277 RepID=A0AAW3RTM1_9GAMM|nr:MULTISPECIES: SagB family peptide dehydrogenase [Pectobacterium]ASN87153.1 Putative peptide maturation protein [Pectobacterium versatile]AZK61465.1 SagB/ThcOx family dehydrogenase [Pectobacterium versatile]MBA0160378.1 SagB family peptide dehydrogenase [Pectobacterium versatile]MBA0163493.1 SagB family peptide dehydrogenase [Pectobacterium versatile]MBA0169662.1 SagB family peptide dehydrogenase [Pectobacterium versatile]
MLNSLWKKTELESDSADMAWEQFHESSKTSRYGAALPNEQIVAEMNNLYTSLPYKNFEPILLPETLSPINTDFATIIQTRQTPAKVNAVPLTLTQLRTILHFAYGETRDNKSNPDIHRPFRTVPSGGALYPLELYFYHSGQIEGLAAGIYHYSPTFNALHFIKPGNFNSELAQALVEFQSHLAEQLSVVIFITGLFQRSIFKYRNKGYRFCLLEAGHVAQNINLAATALQLGVINIGGFYDRKIDDLLEIDGLNHSILYMNGLCAGGNDEPDAH